jgi:phosphoribosyl-ATP pyrophosphohydrolase
MQRADSADLLFHLLVLLESRGLEICDVVQLLAARHRQRSAASSSASAPPG